MTDAELPVLRAELDLVQDADQLAGVAQAFAENATAPATRRAYRADFQTFAAWCDAHGVPPMAATASQVASFLADQAEAGVKASTLARRVAAIRYAYRLKGLEPPTGGEAVRTVLRGIRRTLGAAKDQKAPMTADILVELLRSIPDTITGKRDCALLALGFAGAFRRSELVALHVADLTETPDGLRVLIRRSKTDQDGEGQEIAVPNGTRLRPVQAVKDWLTAAGITGGPVFRRIRRGGHVTAEGLTDKSVADLVKAYAERAGIDAAKFSGHSLRSGFITSGAEAGASILKLAEVSRHKSMETLRGYVRRADLFKDHAGARFL